MYVVNDSNYNEAEVTTQDRGGDSNLKVKVPVVLTFVLIIAQ